MPHLENDNHSVPTWLTQDYIQDKLQKCYKDPSIIVNSLDIYPATAKGENYASVMTRIKVGFKSNKSDEETREESYIIKSTFEGEDRAAEVLGSYGIYTREMEIYEDILPSLANLLHEIGDTDKLYATTVHVDYENSAIIFEDLSVSNYVMADRIARLDMDHAKLALSKLAKLHATAAVLQERRPHVFSNNYDRGFFNKHTDNAKSMMTGMLAALARFVKQDDELNELYYEKVLGLQTRFLDYGLRTFDCNRYPDHFFTLTHGDFWTNNMMFKYDKNGQPIDVAPIDFQFSTWASPTLDLHYFFNCAVREELRLCDQPALVQHYHGILSKTLKALKYKARIPSLFDFHIQFELRNFFALVSAFMFQPIMLCDETEDACYNNLDADSEAGVRFKDALFRNEIVQKNVKRLLPIFDQKGLLDVMD